jgi:hypothetical protein
LWTFLCGKLVNFIHLDFSFQLFSRAKAIDIQHAHLAFLQKQKETVGKMNLLLRLIKQQMTTLEKAQDLYSRYLAG